MERKEVVEITNMCMVYDGDKILIDDNFSELFYYKENNQWKNIIK